MIFNSEEKAQKEARKLSRRYNKEFVVGKTYCGGFGVREKPKQSEDEIVPLSDGAKETERQKKVSARTLIYMLGIVGAFSR